VGYFGGLQQNPTYEKIKDYTEAILIEFDPDVIDYEDVLIDWANTHSPCSPAYSNQYASKIFPLNNSQRGTAEYIIEAIEGQTKRKCFTTIEDASELRFYRAEEYHQNYLNKNRGW